MDKLKVTFSTPGFTGTITQELPHNVLLDTLCRIALNNGHVQYHAYQDGQLLGSGRLKGNNWSFHTEGK